MTDDAARPAAARDAAAKSSPRPLTGLENLGYFRALYRGETRRPEALLARVGLAGDGQRLVAEYSKGMKTRLGVARALLNDPQLIFLDEPTAGPAGRSGAVPRATIRWWAGSPERQAR